MSEALEGTAEKLRAAVEDEDEGLLASLLDPAVRWGEEEETPETCHTREEVLAHYGQLGAAGVRARVQQAITFQHAVVLGLALTRPDSGPASEGPAFVYQVFRFAGDKVIDIRGFPEREDALAWVTARES
jgi:hypothetical protein